MDPLESGDPTRIGRYRLLGRLGAGGMGQVFFGRSTAGRAVAVKRIHPHFATDPSFRERFDREVTSARQVSGAFTAPVIDADPQADFPWLVTSYVPSLPLDSAVQRFGPLPEHTLRVLAAGLAEALNEIHRCGIIHRDLKPGNVLLAEDGPRVIDFGIARATEGGNATQAVIGTPGFMSPEQINGRDLTPASDIFTFGAVLAYAASGTGPFGEGAMPTVAFRIMQHEADLSALPASLRNMVAACLAKDEGQRPQPGRLLDALGDTAAGGPWLPPGMATAVSEQSHRATAMLSAGAGMTQGGMTQGDAQATSVMGVGQDPQRTGILPQDAAAPPAGSTQVMPGTGQQGPEMPPPSASATAVFPGQGAQAGQGTQAGRFEPPRADRTAVFGGDQPAPGQQGQPGQPGGPEDSYGALYRGAAAPAVDPRQAQREQEEERRREAERRAHEERLRVERDAAERAKRQARRAKAPSVWRFFLQLPLLLIPFVQIPLGIGAAYGWQWFTASEFYWSTPWYYSPDVLSLDGFLFALFLGYFIFNNLIGLDWLLRSLRARFVVGMVIAAVIFVGTNVGLSYFGFF
ncbi:serine/threonine protein kinase [Spiractinospora alimapuensis]|uniref:serine/threonine protein kinase n=1 Tax=Spiractinospora alimapuensis TaxID=2820884 RepID=UPI001F234CFB|nr:serine/threonine-protein kinase [Spiractinospora alimapuensis]QVQ52563.1 serine/threonine protein kinase [Spiractinospora alimapuensis]